MSIRFTPRLEIADYRPSTQAGQCILGTVTVTSNNDKVTVTCLYSEAILNGNE